VVAALLVEFRDSLARDWPSANAFIAGVERLIEGREAEYLLGAPDPDSPPAAVCQLRYRYGVWLAAEDCCLEDLFVREEARRSGLGAALVRAALDRARARGCRRVELDVNRANPAAIALYEAFGFSAWVDVPGGENLLMRRRLDEEPPSGDAELRR
jgi:GNAT superfamily N-acetyltransferase